MTETYGQGLNGPLTDLIVEPERTATGNIVLRVGRRIDSDGRWEQAAYVVLTADEAKHLGRKLVKTAAGWGS